MGRGREDSMSLRDAKKLMEKQRVKPGHAMITYEDIEQCPLYPLFLNESVDYTREQFKLLEAELLK